MFRQISFLLLICFASLSVFAQTGKYTAPVKWERYKVSNKDVSVLLPKPPVVIEDSDICREEETRQYAAYANQTIYGFTVTSKTKQKAPFGCPQKKKFDEKNFEARLKQLKDQLKESTETNFTQGDLLIKKLSGVDSIYWLINDFDNQRWFEFWVTERNSEKAEIEKFLKSIEINKTGQGIEIGEGAYQLLGDETVKTDDSQSGVTTALRIVIKPRPRYTDAARQAQNQGTIKLKITFSAHGGISNINPVSGLPNGLTEQAIYAAQRIVFIPPRKNGVPYAMVKTVEYTFAIY